MVSIEGGFGLSGLWFGGGSPYPTKASIAISYLRSLYCSGSGGTGSSDSEHYG